MARGRKSSLSWTGYLLLPSQELASSSAKHGARTTRVVANVPNGDYPWKVSLTESAYP